MKSIARQSVLFLVFAVCVTAAPMNLHAQSQSSAEQMLVSKAEKLTAMGQNSLAAQVWKQVLMVDPNNVRALEALARWEKYQGHDAQAEKYLQRLGKLGVDHQEITEINATTSRKTQKPELKHAAQLAKEGHPKQAMKIYRHAFGNQPPKNWAEAYYDTEAAIPSRHENAIHGLRALVASYPANNSYAINLGRELTYNPRTRLEGIRILEKYPENSLAQAALRQALSYSVRNPAYFPLIREYLRHHPDEQLAGELKQAEREASASSKSGLARTPAERSAYAALAANHLKEAEKRFKALHRDEPGNPRVLAGLGFVQMKKSNFAEAIRYFMQAMRDGLPHHYVARQFQASIFWNAMQKGTQALAENHQQAAQREYLRALMVRPGNPAALEGLAGAYMKASDPGKAERIYRKLVKAEPDSPHAWRGFFAAEVQAGHPEQAVQLIGRFPKKVRASLKNDPQFLQSLASAYMKIGDREKARMVLTRASKLPGSRSASARLHYANLLADNGDYLAASQLYHQVLQGDSDQLKAWQGLVSIEQKSGHDAHAIAVVEEMPPVVYNRGLGDPEFLILLAHIYQQQKRYGLAQNFLHRAVEIYSQQNQPVPESVQLQRASLALEMGQSERAWPIFRAILNKNPGELQAWQVLLAGLHQLGRDADGLAELRQIPSAVHARLDENVNFQQTEAQIYAATGNAPIALGIVKRIQKYYRAQNVEPPVGVEIQDAWLLYNLGSNRDLYGTLMNLGDRTDLTRSQRRTVQTIWASWAVKRAGRDSETGETQKAVAILKATQRSFPGNPAVTKALATGYLKVGEPKRAVQLYRSLNTSNASAREYAAMVGTALAAHKRKQAEIWLREGLQKYPHNPDVLTAAARFEQARGDNTRAAAYWKAALHAMPKVSPGTELAHQMDQAQVSRLARASGLAGLLNPEPNVSRMDSIPLPGYRHPSPEVATNESSESYGPDPYYMGTAPVILSPRQRAQAVFPKTSTAPALSNASIAPPPMQAGGQHEEAHIHRGKTKSGVLARRKQETRRRSAMRRARQQLARVQHPVNESRVGSQYHAVQPAGQLSMENKPAQAGDSNLYYVRPSFPQTSGKDEDAEMQPMQGASDSQLMQENLPPLGGPYARPKHPEQKTPRQVAKNALARIESGYSGWLGGTAYVNHRSGNPGYDQLSIFDAPIEASAPFGTAARLSVIVNPVFLDSGQATQIPIIGPGDTPELLGSEIKAPKTPPTQQNAAGVGGSIQMATKNFGAAVGYTPYGFLVSNITARLRWHPSNGPFTFSFSREAIKDSQLSYSGLRDPASISSSYAGNIWGGVMANSFELQFGKSMGNSGFYLSGGGEYITGKHVETNHRIDGDAGAYWRVWAVPEEGHLTVGVNLFGMHYAHNLTHFTYGQGGYFSPQAYMLANLPFTWEGQYERKWHYRIAGAFGIQGFQEDSSPYYPLDPVLEAKSNYLTYAAQTVVGGNYNLSGEASYHIGSSWYVGGFTNLNNTLNYNNQTAGFFVRFLFRPQHSSEQGPSGLFPYKGLRPFMVP